MIKHRKSIKEIPCDGPCGGPIAKGNMYFRQTAFEPPKCYCEKCYSTGASDYLMWVGTRFYPTIEGFVEEASRLGVCKRVPKPPSDMKPGVSRVFLVHDEGKIVTPEEKDTGILSHGKIFGFFPIMGIRVVLDNEDTIAKYQDRIKGVPLEIIGTQQAMQMETRGCGRLLEGATYLISPASMDDVWEASKDLANWMEIRGGIIHFKTYVDVPWLSRFRGIKHMEPGTTPVLDDLGISLGRFQMHKVDRQVSARRK